MDATTAELRAAHDQLSELYAEHLNGALASMPTDRAVLDLFCELSRQAGPRAAVGDIGCGTGRLAPYLAAQGLTPQGVDLSPGMIDCARRDFPGFDFTVGDVRALPFADAALAGVVCWYSLMFLPPADRPAAFAELFRVVRPGGYLTTAFKAGDDQVRRGGHTVGVAFDIYWLSMPEMERRLHAAGFTTVFRADRPAEATEATPQAYLIARRPPDAAL